MVSHVLFESASGYALFSAALTDEVGARERAVQESITDLAKFQKMVALVSFSPFKSAAHALENANDVSEGILNDHLKSLLELNLAKPSKKSSIVLAVSDANLAGAIKAGTGIACDTSASVAQELVRGVRLHAAKLLAGMGADALRQAQLGLGHAYSRAKLKFNVNRADNMIIQAVALLDTLDKDVNTFAMRVREWYGYHFPELVRIVPDNYQYARAAQFVGDKDALDESKLPELAALLDDDAVRAQNVLDAARGSMGAALSPVDMLNINLFAGRVVSLAEYRKSLTAYLAEKMAAVAPSLTALLGERIGARLISHAGSLTNLSKYPASTVQILGAEKALFRALKTKGNTPKYGLLYHSTFIGRAGPKHKGRISRFLANKCSIASRIDCYSDVPTPKFGEALRQQVEERLAFFETGAPPAKNADAIRAVLDQLALDDAGSDDEDDGMAVDKPQALTSLEISPPPAGKKEKKKKRKADAMDVDGDDDDDHSEKKVKLSKEEKKALKKAKKAEHKAAAVGAEPVEGAKKEKKKKEKKSKVAA